MEKGFQAKESANRSGKDAESGGIFRYLRYFDFDKICQSLLQPKDLANILLALNTFSARFGLGNNIRTFASAILVVRKSLLVTSTIRLGPGLLFGTLGSLDRKEKPV